MDSQRKRLVDSLAVENRKRGVYDWKVAVDVADGVLLGKVEKDCGRRNQDVVVMGSSRLNSAVVVRR